MLRRQADRPLVQRHGLDDPSFQARPFRRDQRVLMRERRRAARRPSLKRFQVCDEILASPAVSPAKTRERPRRWQKNDKSNSPSTEDWDGPTRKLASPWRQNSRALLRCPVRSAAAIAGSSESRQREERAPENSRFVPVSSRGRRSPLRREGFGQSPGCQDDQLTEFVFADEIQGACRLKSTWSRGSPRATIGEAMSPVPAGVDHLAGFRDSSDRGLEAAQGIFDRTCLRTAICMRKCAPAFCAVNVRSEPRPPTCKCLPVCEAMQLRTKCRDPP